MCSGRPALAPRSRSRIPVAFVHLLFPVEPLSPPAWRAAAQTRSCVRRDSSVPKVPAPPRLCLPLPPGCSHHPRPLLPSPPPVFTAASSVSTRGTLPMPRALLPRPPGLPLSLLTPLPIPLVSMGAAVGECGELSSVLPSLSLLSFWGSSLGWLRGQNRGPGSPWAPRGPRRQGWRSSRCQGHSPHPRMPVSEG